ncbi:unnamed protein product [Leptidea sinapis]|uniref:Uncharacterized protein n=1 Tax=Leptidea sinapis TaxID=189913 RepID=A0A5E4PPF0_9NEOP|nr:unnamed protein product [Leptidea sinapis]
MEMTHQGGAEAESLLRADQRSALVMPQGTKRWDEAEKAPFLRNEPVKLTPAWEGSNLPNDTLNLKGIAMDLVPPRDKWNLIYLTLLLHGLGTLTAWNMFITAKPYFEDYKLVNARQYAANFMPYVGWACQIPNLVFSWLNIFVKFGGNLTVRIVWSLCIEVCIFVVTVILAMLDSSEWPEVFFWLTMVSVFFLNVVLGSNICGTLVVLIGWASDTFTQSYRTAAIYYFISGMFVLLRFYRYHETLQQRTLRANPTLATSNPGGNPTQKKIPFKLIIRQAAVQLYNVFIVFFVTLAVFPTIHSDIKPLTATGFIGDNFLRLTCFLTFNPGPRWLSVFTTLRILFIPLFLLCNYHPKDRIRTMPVWVSNDWAYWILASTRQLLVCWVVPC